MIDENRDDFQHQSVLLAEAIDALAIDPTGIYIDATFGRGGHSREILQRLNDQGRLIVIDKDPQAIAVANQLAQQDKRVSVIHDSFTAIQDSTQFADVKQNISGILFDLGVSSPQLDDVNRGFSFQADGPLDMRMDTSRGQSAAEWIATVSEQQLAQIFKDYGEERYAKRIAAAVCQARDDNPITRTLQLADIIKQANPNWEKHKHPATRCFQAIRIFINSELNDLTHALNHSLDLLAVGGRLVVISFHSLEDRLVKQFMRAQAKGPDIPKEIPVLSHQIAARMKIISKAVRANSNEVQQNPRARSAVLRIAEKIQ